MLTILIAVLFIHYLGDFVFQTRWMAENKGKDIKALLIHVGIYTAVLFGGLSLYKGYVGHVPTWGLVWFVLVNGLTHLVIDFCTSKLNNHLWTSQKTTFFWWSVGFDQFLHAALLLYTASLFGLALGL